MVYELWRCIEVKMSIPRRSPCLKTVQRKNFQRGIFLLLRPVLLKNAYFNSDNRQLSIDIRHEEMRFRKISLHISSCHMSMESYRLPNQKYAFFSRTGRKTKKLPRSKLFLWTVFRHGLLEGSTILLQYSARTRTPQENSPLGVVKYAISAGQDVRPKNKSIQKCKK